MNSFKRKIFKRLHNQVYIVPVVNVNVRMTIHELENDVVFVLYEMQFLLKDKISREIFKV